MNQFETESGCALSKAAEEAGLLLGVVGGGSGVFIKEFAFESTVNKDGELTRGSGDGLGLADAGGKTAVEAAQCGLGAAQGHGGHAECGGGTIGRGLGAGAEQPAAGDFVVWGEGEPGGEMFFAWPSAHIRADFGDQFEGGIRGNAVDLRQIHAAGNVMERGPDIETGLIVAGLFAGARTGQRGGRRLDGFGQRLDMSFDGLVASSDLSLTGVEKFKILP